MDKKLVDVNENFEHTLEDVLSLEYDEYLQDKYKINRAYIHENIDQLIQLRDVLIPSMTTIGKPKRIIQKRFRNDLDIGEGKLGIYQWFNLFNKIHDWRDIKDMIEDETRMLLDLVKKYPEHSEIIQLIEK